LDRQDSAVPATSSLTGAKAADEDVRATAREE